jgi:hypothetical protein
MLPHVADSRLREWLAGHDDNLCRFRELIPLSTVALETGIEIDTIREAISAAEPPIFHIWSHKYAGSARPNKPYCLRLAGPDAVCLDWEASIVALAEADFRRRGYSTCKELGTSDHIRCLIADPDVAKMTAGVNLRDFWAQRRNGNNVDFWIVEAKGKEAGGFDRYCFAETLSQLFEIPAQPLTALLGNYHKASHGLCIKLASQLLNGWKEQGWHATITLAVLIPLWECDVIWDGRTAKHRSKAYYRRPFEEFVEFIDQGTSHSSSKKKGEAAFGKILEGLESQFSLRALAHSNSNLCFRVLTAGYPATKDDFGLHKFPA